MVYRALLLLYFLKFERLVVAGSQYARKLVFQMRKKSGVCTNNLNLTVNNNKIIPAYFFALIKI